MRKSVDSWRDIRRLRASPPGAAKTTGARVDTFRAALEQSEQQLRAAANVDYDSRSLNLFYGLSQAGRALAAAATTLNDDELDWRLDGHGLKRPDVSQATYDLASVSVRPDGREKSSFVRVSCILDSPTPSRLTLGELWPLMYDTVIAEPLTQEIYSPLDVFLHRPNLYKSRKADEADITLPAALQRVPISKRPALHDYLARYPALKGWQVANRKDDDWPEGSQLKLLWQHNNNDSDDAHILEGRLLTYRRHQLVFPAFEGQSSPMNPLMAWWAVLYVLSTLTRYDPDNWTKLIDINRSTAASALEFVLDVAVDALPDLIEESIRYVATDTDQTR